MNLRWLFAFVAVTFALNCGAWAQENAQEKSAVPAAEPNEAELSAIRESISSFKKAFDAGDAKAVAAHWTVDGEYIDESGRRLFGLDAIEKEFAAFFAANPGAKLISKVEKLRLINAETAIEEGTDRVEPAPAGAPGGSTYSAILVKRDGKWLMWSVRESRIDVPSNYGHLQLFDGMIGTWTAENEGVEFEATSQWIADKNFIEQKFKSTRAGEVVSSGTQIIGWDPAAVGIWHLSDNNSFVVETTGTLIDGTPTTAVNIVSKLDKNAVVWRSVNRTAGAFRVLDTNEVVLRRKPAEKK
jgi:uncharacterized protein (TIGR02246 family)